MTLLENLKSYLAKLSDNGLCVAFSGGVDSATVLKAACLVCGNVHAVTVKTPFHPVAEASEAEALAKEYGAVYKLMVLDAIPEEITRNPPDRCYICKKLIFGEILSYAKANGIATVLDGTNADDTGEYRPGLKALSELGINSPLKELGLVKSQVREIAAALGLDVAEKPSAPCLATRIPYNTQITPETLAAISELETAVKAVCAREIDVRARVHGDTVRLEVLPEAFTAIVNARERLLNKAKALGFMRLTLDLAGFKSGSFDKGRDS